MNKTETKDRRRKKFKKIKQTKKQRKRRTKVVKRSMNNKAQAKVSMTL